MRVTRTLRTWDRYKAEFVEVTVEYSPDTTMACRDCRYYVAEKSTCEAVGSWYRNKRIPFPEFVPNASECRVRLHPDLLSFISS